MLRFLINFIVLGAILAYLEQNGSSFEFKLIFIAGWLSSGCLNILIKSR